MNETAADRPCAVGEEAGAPFAELEVSVRNWLAAVRAGSATGPRVRPEELDVPFPR